MRIGKGSGKNFEDRTGRDLLGVLLSGFPSSQSGLTQGEVDMMDNGWSVNDLYFNRAAQTESDLIPNKGATYSGGQLFEEYKRRKLERQLDFLRKRRLQR